MFGPQFGFNAGSNTVITNGTESDSTIGVLSLKQTDIDLAYGAGLNFSFSQSKAIHVGIGFRGAYGITNIGNTSQTLAKDNYYIINGTNIKTYSGYWSLTFGF